MWNCHKKDRRWYSYEHDHSHHQGDLSWSPLQVWPAKPPKLLRRSWSKWGGGRSGLHCQPAFYKPWEHNIPLFASRCWRGVWFCVVLFKDNFQKIMFRACFWHPLCLRLAHITLKCWTTSGFIIVFTHLIIAQSCKMSVWRCWHFTTLSSPFSSA